MQLAGQKKVLVIVQLKFELRLLAWLGGAGAAAGLIGVCELLSLVGQNQIGFDFLVLDAVRDLVLVFCIKLPGQLLAVQVARSGLREVFDRISIFSAPPLSEALVRRGHNDDLWLGELLLGIELARAVLAPELFAEAELGLNLLGLLFAEREIHDVLFTEQQVIRRAPK